LAIEFDSLVLFFKTEDLGDAADVDGKDEERALLDVEGIGDD